MQRTDEHTSAIARAETSRLCLTLVDFLCSVRNCYTGNKNVQEGFFLTANEAGKNRIHWCTSGEIYSGSRRDRSLVVKRSNTNFSSPAWNREQQVSTLSLNDFSGTYTCTGRTVHKFCRPVNPAEMRQGRTEVTRSREGMLYYDDENIFSGLLLSDPFTAFLNTSRLLWSSRV